jgi:hypothetical protein
MKEFLKYRVTNEKGEEVATIDTKESMGGFTQGEKPSKEDLLYKIYSAICSDVESSLSINYQEHYKPSRSNARLSAEDIGFIKKVEGIVSEKIKDEQYFKEKENQVFKELNIKTNDLPTHDELFKASHGILKMYLKDTYGEEK